MEMSLGMYTVARQFSEEMIEHGLPFVAMSDSHAKKMTYEAVKDELDVEVAASTFILFKIGSYDPRKGQPFIPLREPVCVCTCDRLFLKKGDAEGGDDEDG